MDLMPQNMNPAEFMNAHDVLKAFLDRISLVFIEYFKINCHNRSRQRRMLGKLIAEWEILQEEAAGVDEVFHRLVEQQLQGIENGAFIAESSADTAAPYYFSSWAYDLKLNMIEKILFLGFELELYGPHEYIMIYWYLQCVLGSRTFLLERMTSFTVEQTSSSPAVLANSKQTTSTTEVVDYVQVSQLLTQTKKILCEAILKLLLTAQYTGQLRQFKPIFDDEETRYTQRFKPFAALSSPPHPTYPMFLENITVEEMDVPQMLMIIKTDLERVRRYLEHILVLMPEEVNMDKCFDYFKSVRMAMVCG
ncbi:hypothetical protein BDF20DRAFT_532982 [Mycotypha africana]|uniref:uncharacterized protein n=1 Tax=Mycotypha africana TaxID=64632 RepID=UPI002301CD03|nr:uncharacterized protein BDF20DRAFT_532982 [Mycotypha africana]KAI8979808.1 hypothetical protein BDF20DRAFT_532982 [Mycotypha africana]